LSAFAGKNFGRRPYKQTFQNREAILEVLFQQNGPPKSSDLPMRFLWAFRSNPLRVAAANIKP
jgi:hypothetical protein